MPDDPDLKIRKAPEEPQDPWGSWDLKDAGSADTAPRRRAGTWILTGVVVVAAAIAVYFVGLRQPAPPAAPPAQTRAPEKPAAQPLGGEAGIDLPPLEQSDRLVRELVRMISSHPAVAAWLATDGLIRNFATVVINVADGKTPAGQLRPLRPRSEFRTLGRTGALSIDPRSYQRYDTIAAAAASLDPAGSARVYGTLKPRIEDANRELGFPNTPFDHTLERAIVSLLATPVVDGTIAVEPQGIVYAFANPRLEALTDAQKHLLRTGPHNVRTIQSALRAIALALGIPAERLPAAGAKG
jgi:DUF3014 family protein